MHELPRETEIFSIFISYFFNANGNYILAQTQESNVQCFEVINIFCLNFIMVL
jgi:hypothetical protein